MGLFKRVGDILSANLNEMVERFEDPDKMLRQVIVEMESVISLATGDAARVIANERLIARQLDENRRQVQHWQCSAEAAVRVQDDEAARHALCRKAEHEKLAAALADQHSAALAAARKLRRQLDGLRVRLAEARRKQLTLAARKRAADATRRLAENVSDVTIDDAAFGKFDRMSRKVEQAEAEADAFIELTGLSDLLDRAEDAGIAVEAELASLKQQLASQQ